MKSKKGIGRKGQAAVEVIIISVVLLGFMLATAFLMTQRNIATAEIAGIQRDTIRCDKISSVITGFSPNKGYSETSLQSLGKNARVEKGSVLIGSIACMYAGKAWKQVDNSGDEMQDFEEDTAGFNLEKGKMYRVKKLGRGVTFCDTAKTWC